MILVLPIALNLCIIASYKLPAIVGVIKMSKGESFKVAGHEGSCYRDVAAMGQATKRQWKQAENEKGCHLVFHSARVQIILVVVSDWLNY